MITVSTLQNMKAEQNKIVMLTCYDASFTVVLEEAGVDVLLIGDSLGMTIQGHTSTIPVTLADMCYHTQSVARAAKKALILADLPFGSYEQNPQQAFASASHLLAAGAHMVKFEGGGHMVETTHFLQQRGIPVCAHLGLTPQSVNVFGGYKVQAKEENAARNLLRDAKAHEEAGASMVLMECVPAELADKVSKEVSCPTIGIGAGEHCDGQVLVLHDMLGITSGRVPRFVQNFMVGQSSVQAAIQAYVDAVKSGDFPKAEHSY